MMKRNRLLRDPYGAEIWLLFGTAKELDGYLCRKHGGKDHVTPNSRANFTTFTAVDSPTEDPIHYISLVKERSRGRLDYAGYLAHECVHAVFEVFEVRGIAVDSVHDEPFAYYHEWLFRQCLRAVW